MALELEPGSIYALLGPNGSGKSTLLKTLCRTIPTLGGTILFGAHALERLSERDLAKRVAYVPQEELPHFGFTVRQVVTMGRMPHNASLWDSAPDTEAATSAMRDADCLYLEDRPVTEISGGERQRAYIARALAQAAPILLLDEPTAHLDVAHQVTTVTLLKRLADQGYAVMAAVHDLNVASSFAKNAILLNEGRVSMLSPISDVLESGLLDEAYGIEFERLRDARGMLRVFPFER